MRLILNGGGSGDQVKDSYRLFGKEINGGKVMYIPLAWNHGNLENCIDWFREEIKPFGVTYIDQILKPEQITKERLKNVSGIFIGGGNTFKLLKMLKDTEAFDNLQCYINNNGLVMGSSAGALIFGKSINTCLKNELNINSTDKNLVGLKDTNGFNAIKGYSLFVHYKKQAEQLSQTQEYVDRLLKLGHRLICLPEETSVWINQDKISIIGQKPAEMFDNDVARLLEPAINKDILENKFL